MIRSPGSVSRMVAIDCRISSIPLDVRHRMRRRVGAQREPRPLPEPLVDDVGHRPSVACRGVTAPSPSGAQPTSVSTESSCQEVYVASTKPVMPMVRYSSPSRSRLKVALTRSGSW